MGNRALVLNATYEPIAVVSLHRAVILVLAEKAAVVAADEHAVLRSVSVSLPQPTVIRLTCDVRVPYRRAVTLSRLAVLRRDQHRCQYCDAKADTVDHVVPRSRGGAQSWGNLASACHRVQRTQGRPHAGRSGHAAAHRAARSGRHLGDRDRVRTRRRDLDAVPG